MLVTDGSMKAKEFLVRTGLGIALSALSAMLVVLAFPPYNLWVLVWIAFIPFILAQYRVMPPKLSSLAAAIFNGGWVWGYLGPVFRGSGTFMVYLAPAVALISFVADMTSRQFHERTHYRWFMLQGVTAWIGIEMIRLFLPIAGTWGFIAYTLHSQPWLIQPASIFGIFGASALIVIVNYALGMAALALYDRRVAGAPGPIEAPLRRHLPKAAALSVGWVVLSLALFRQPATATRRVAAVQPDAGVISAHFSGQEERVAALLDQMVEQTRQAAQQGAQFIVWPEGGYPGDPQQDDRINLAGLAQELDIYLSVGYAVMEEAGLRNEATVINPAGEYLGVFGKDHPVTFGGETSLTRGTYPVYDTTLGKLGTIICYDLDFTDTARKLSRQGAQLIAVPSQDWGAIADKHYTHVVFRAVENRVAMVKADGGFDSAIIDAYGRVISLASYPEGGGALLVADVPLGEANALAIRLGDWVGWLGLLSLGFFTFGGNWLVKRAESA